MSSDIYSELRAAGYEDPLEVEVKDPFELEVKRKWRRQMQKREWERKMQEEEDQRQMQMWLDSLKETPASTVSLVEDLRSIAKEKLDGDMTESHLAAEAARLGWVRKKQLNPMTSTEGATPKIGRVSTMPQTRPRVLKKSLSPKWTGKNLAKRRAELGADGRGAPMKRLSQETGLPERAIRKLIENYKKTKEPAAADLQGVWRGPVTRHRMGE